MSTRDYQIGGTHYQRTIQPWDIIETYDLNFWEGNAIKYICRQKGDRIEDLKKAVHYLEHEIERLSSGFKGTDIPSGTHEVVDGDLSSDMIQCQACSLLYHGNPVDSFCPRCGYKPL